MALGEDEEEQAPPPRPQQGGGGDGGGKRGAKRVQAPLPPPAQRQCARGHALTPVNAKPADYAKLEGGEGNCDLCDVDFF